MAIHCEDRQSYGRVDCTLEMEEYVYIFEFKMDGTAREALKQIEEWDTTNLTGQTREK